MIDTFVMKGGGKFAPDQAKGGLKKPMSIGSKKMGRALFDHQNRFRQLNIEVFSHKKAFPNATKSNTCYLFLKQNCWCATLAKIISNKFLFEVVALDFEYNSRLPKVFLNIADLKI